MTSLCNLRFYLVVGPVAGLFCALLTLGPSAIMAQNSHAPSDLILAQPYADLARHLPRREGFEAWPNRPEPGHLLQSVHRGSDITVGSYLSGQTPGILTQNESERFDILTDITPDLPLSLATVPMGQGLAIAHHRGFGSNAVFPLGPDGFGQISGRGEGSLAVLFDHDQRATGFLVHSDYPDPLGSRAALRGTVKVILLAREGQVLARYITPLEQGITAIGYATTSGAPEIAAMVILNTDPGGIAIDDILYDNAVLSGGLPRSGAHRLQASWQAGRGALLLTDAWQIAQIFPRDP
jgi:hypothetical protein